MRNTSYETGINWICNGAVGPRIRATLDQYAQRKGMPVTEYVKTRTGFMGTLLALNKAAGMNVYDVVEEEAFDESAVTARRTVPNFILDDQTHIYDLKAIVNPPEGYGRGLVEWMGMHRKAIMPEGDIFDFREITKDVWVKEVLVYSDIDVTFLNTLGFNEIFGGNDLFPTEACVELTKQINEDSPGRVMTLGTIEPNQPGHLEKLERYFREVKMSGLKLYPWDATKKGGWWADDEKLAYPIWEKCVQLGVNNIHIHKGLPATWTMVKYVHPSDLDNAIRDFPQLNFIVYHSGWPYVDELCGLNQGRPPNPNLYTDLGATFAILMNTPVALAHEMGKLLRWIGADHICWGTDAPIWGAPQFLIDAFRKFTIPDELIGGYGYPEFTDEHKELIFGRNMAKLYKLDVDAIRSQVKNDGISKARKDLAAA